MFVFPAEFTPLLFKKTKQKKKEKKKRRRKEKPCH